MNIKKHLPWLGALLPVASMQAETKPNVVVIYVDDMGIGDIGCYGGKFVPTPNIDKIAQDGCYSISIIHPHRSAHLHVAD